MNKRLKNIIILIAVIAIALGANIWLKLSGDGTGQQADANTPIYISNYSLGSVHKMIIENEYGVLTLLYEDGIWYAEGREDVELDQGIVGELTYMLTHIVGQRVVSEEKDTSNLYGMLTPSATITTYHDGVLEQSFIIGDEAPIENEYYMQSSVYKKVYTVDMAYYIYGQLKVEDLMVLGGIDVEHEDMHKIHIVNSLGQEYTIKRTADDNDISLCYWEFAEPFNHDIDTALMYGTDEYEGMITYISELAGEKIIGYRSDSMYSYGMDKPLFTGEIYTDDEMVQSFTMGDIGDEDNYSLIFSDDLNVYSVSKDRVPFIDYSAYMTAESNLSLINIDSVDKILIDLPNAETTVSVDHVVMKNADGTDVVDSNGNAIYQAKINISGLDESALAAVDIDQQKIYFYQDIVTIKIDDLLMDYEFTGDKVGSIVFELSSKYRDTYTIEFFDYSKSHYIARKNGESAGYLVNKKAVEELADRYNLLLKGQLEADY